MKKMVNRLTGEAGTMPDEPFPSLLANALYTERELVKTLPFLISEAGDETLREALERHLEETRGHVTNVEEIFRCFGAEPAASRSAIMDGLKSAHDEMRDRTPHNRRDLAVAAAAAATEHAEISTYESLRTIADAHGNDDVVQLVDQNLSEERHALQLAQQAGQELSTAHADDVPL